MVMFWSEASLRVLIPTVFGSPAPLAKIGHAMAVNEMHITKHGALPDQSVPSPGAGN